MAISANGGEDLICGSDPFEGFGIGVSLVDVVHDIALELVNAAMGAALDLFFSEFGKEALDQVEP